MQEYIHMRLRGGLPPDKTKLPTLSMMLDAAENAMAKLGWSYTRFLFRTDTYYGEAGREYGEKWLDYYRQAGIDEKYITVKTFDRSTILYTVGNFTRTEILHEAAPEQEKIIRDLCRRKGRYSSFRIIYQGVKVPHEYVTDCCIGGASVSVASSDGWDVGIARRVTEEYAAAVGMRVDRQWYRNRAFY